MDDHPIEDDGDHRPHHSDSDGDNPADNAAANDKSPGADVDNSEAGDENPGVEDGNLPDKAGKPGNLLADGNLGASDGVSNPPRETDRRSSVISRVVVDGKFPTTSGGGSPVASWSQASTEALIDAWGDFYVRGSGKLSYDDWEEVAASVSAGHTAKTVKQCKNRVDSVKTSFKICADAGGSRFFDKLSRILGRTDAAPQVPATIPTTARSVQHHAEKSEWLSEDMPPSAKRRRVGEAESPSRTLARAIEGFAEAYGKVEMEKMKQEARMGERLMTLVKDLESERIKLYKIYQEEINKLIKK